MAVVKFCCHLVTKLCPTLCDPIDCTMPGSSVHHSFLELLKFIESVMLSNHLILCHPLLLPSIFPSSRVFPKESALHIRWSKYWSFSFSISPSNEYSGLISFRIDSFGLLAVQGILNSLQHHSPKSTVQNPQSPVQEPSGVIFQHGAPNLPSSVFSFYFPKGRIFGS